MKSVGRIVALGGSICRILQGAGAPRSSRFRQPTRICGTGWVRLNNLGLRGSETLEFEVWRFWRLEVTNVSRIVALGGSIYRILRVSEAPGSSRFRQAKLPGRSA